MNFTQVDDAQSSADNSQQITEEFRSSLYSRLQNTSIIIQTKDCKISIKNAEGRLEVTIETPRLIIRSFSEQDSENYYTLYSNPDVVKLFHDGKPKSRKLVKERYLDIWINDWKSKRPFSAFAIYEREKDNTSFVGNIAVDHIGDDPGEADFTYILMNNHWRKGYGSEAVNSVLNNFVPLMVCMGYNTKLIDKAFFKAIATVRLDNVPSVKILQKNMDKDPTPPCERYGAIRQLYFVSKEMLLSRLYTKSSEVLSIEPIQTEPTVKPPYL